MASQLDAVQTVVYDILPSLKLDACKGAVRKEQWVTAGLLYCKRVLLFCASVVARCEKFVSFLFQFMRGHGHDYDRIFRDRVGEMHVETKVCGDALQKL